MTVGDVFAIVERWAPFATQTAYDNAGLLIGSPYQPVHKIGVVLDATADAADYAAREGIDLLVTHHPVIFSPLTRVPCGSAVYRLIQNGVAVISAHTNLDAARGGVNDCLAERLELTGLSPLALPDSDGLPPMGRIGTLPQSMTADELAAFLCERLGTHCRYAAGETAITTVAVCGGAGADLLMPACEAGAQAVITAEVKHHQFLQAADLGMTLIDAGHFETEVGVVARLCERLRQAVDCPVTAIPQSSPTRYR